MKTAPWIEIERYRVMGPRFQGEGAFLIPGPFNMELKVIASQGCGWEHVSVSLKNRTPNWKEMCFIKDIFWGDEELVIQYHPQKSQYVDCHPNCLHLWKPIGHIVLQPPRWMVGPYEGWEADAKAAGIIG